jgi:hypothetical protein
VRWFPLSLAWLLASCSALHPGRRATLDWLDGHATPESAVAQGCLLPLAIPVGLTGFVADTALVNPAVAVGDAWGDTAELLWTPRDETPLRQVFLVPLAGLATPLVFAGDWLGRCLLPLPPRGAARTVVRVGGP